MQKLVDSFNEKSGTHTYPELETTEAVMLGLAQHLDQLGRPLCPCRFYPDKIEEIKHRTWVYPCEDMQIYGLVKDPTPDKGRAMRNKAAEREEERRN